MSGKSILASILSILITLSAQGQVNAFFSPVIFNTSEHGPFIETNLTINGTSLSALRTDGKYRNAVLITTTIKSDSTILKTARYNLHGPFFNDSLKAPAFIDVQRYFIPNGKYQVEMSICDKNLPGSKPLVIQSDLNVEFTNKSIETSCILPVESYKKSIVKGPLSKSGFDLLPYNSILYPESSDKLTFYLEAYNAAAELGNGQPLVFSWYIENAADSSKLSSFGSFKKDRAAAVNVLLASCDIKKLGSGEFALVVEVRDGSNSLRKREKLYFSRRNGMMDIAALQNLTGQELLTAFTGRTYNADTLVMYVDCLWPIADDTDKQRIVEASVKKDPSELKHFVVDFWQRRAADTANALQLWAGYYQKVQQVNLLFKCGKQKGYYTDRGRVFLQYGSPNQRTEQNNEPNTFPYEIWEYYRINDATNGNFFSNRKFVFVNRNLGDECYNLVHSDMRGENNNPRWRYQVTRHNSDGLGNPDNNMPGGTEHNQFNEIYQNPR